MKQNDNKGKLDLKELGPVWKVKIGILSGVSNNSIVHYKKAKKLKLKVILN